MCSTKLKKMQTAKEIQQELEQYIDPVKREYLPNFFKTGKGQYGEGDKFLGIVVPNTRIVAKRHKDAPFKVMVELLQSEWHECRLCALLMLVERFKKCDEKDKKEIFNFYLTQTARINNWDLVDLSAPGIVGEYLKDKPRDVLYRLADSDLLWDQRIAVVSTYTLIKNDDFIDIIALSEHFLHTRHDLMRKAVGWMLREMGKRDKKKIVAVSIPVNLHKYFPSQTVRNFFSVVNIGYCFDGSSDRIEDIAVSVRDTLAETLNSDYLQERLDTLAAVEHWMIARVVPLFIKNIVLKRFYLRSEREYTTTLSNVGQVEMPPEMSPYIHRFDVFNSTKDLQACLCSFGNRMSISFTSQLLSNDIERRFFRTLTAMGIPVELSYNRFEGMGERD